MSQDDLQRTRRLARGKSHVRLHGGDRGESIQHVVRSELRLNGTKLMSLFRKWDVDGSNTIERAEFHRALKELRIAGGVEDYDSLFDAWDSDGSGCIQYTELLSAMSGRRYDAFAAFDIDIGDGQSRIAAAAAKAYAEAAVKEAEEARAMANQQAVDQRAWLRSKWRVARTAISATVRLSGLAHSVKQDQRLTDIDADLNCLDFTKATDFGPAESNIADDMTAGCQTLARQASQEAARLSELAITAQLDARADRQLRAEDELKRKGLSYEYLDLPLAKLLPLLTEMVFARVVGASDAAFARLPNPNFHGPQPKSGSWYRPPMSQAHCTSTSESIVTQARGSNSKSSAQPVPAAALVLVARWSEDVSWLAELPPHVDYHIMQKHELLPTLPHDKQTLVPDVGGTSHAFLSFLYRTAQRMEGGRGYHPVARDKNASAVAKRREHGGSRTKSGNHVVLNKAEKDGSIQEVIHNELRRRSVRVQDIFKKWDCDRSNSISRIEFCRALRELRITGTSADFESLFNAWDIDHSGSIQYTELLEALSGQRYDALRKVDKFPIPPLLVCTPADPFSHNPRWLEDVNILVAMSKDNETKPVPFTPLGHTRGNEAHSLDLPSWSRPLVFCDPSGAPQQEMLLPIGAAWRHLFGPERPVPLWISFCSGHTFAVSRESCLQRNGEQAASFYKRALTTCVGWINERTVWLTWPLRGCGRISFNVTAD